MGRPHHPQLPKPGFSKRRILACVVSLCFVGPCLASLADPAEDPKDFVLFLGLDLKILDGGAEGRIEDLASGAVRVAFHNTIRTMPLRTLGELHFVYEPKLSRASVTIAKAAGDRAYTPARDPARDMITQQMLMVNVQAERTADVSSAERQLEEARLAEARNPQANLQATPPAEERLERAQWREGHTSTYQSPSGPMGPDAGSYDAFAVTFEIASDCPIKDAYAALLVSILVPDSPKTPVQTVALRRLPAIDTRPRKVRLDANGLPPGFALDRYEIHIYSQGCEIPTNLSSGRVDLTRSEAYQYLWLRHSIAHKRESVAPVLVVELLPDNAHQRVPEDQHDREVEVFVDREGHVARLNLDPWPSDADDRSIETLLREVRFLPALVAGEPSPGGAHLILGDLVRWTAP